MEMLIALSMSVILFIFCLEQCYIGLNNTQFHFYFYHRRTEINYLVSDAIMSYIKTIKNNDPKTEPCGTPHIFSKGFDIYPIMAT